MNVKNMENCSQKAQGEDCNLTEMKTRQFWKEVWVRARDTFQQEQGCSRHVDKCPGNFTTRKNLTAQGTKSVLFF